MIAGVGLSIPFRYRLLLAMLLVVAIFTTGILAITQRDVAHAYAAMFQAQFDAHLRYARRLQDTRLADVKRRCAALASNVRLGALMREINETAGAGSSRTSI